MDVPPWENVLFLGDASGRRFIRDARSKFSLSLAFSFLLGTKGDNGIVVGFVCHSTPSYFDFSRFKYCTIYILWFAHRRGRREKKYVLRLLFLHRVFKSESPTLLPLGKGTVQGTI